VFIRYFARTDDSPVGVIGAAYCDALIDTGVPVRLVSARVAELQVDVRGRSLSAWDRHRALLATPMTAKYVNVICGEIIDWQRFYTNGVTNALLIAEPNLEPRNSQDDITEAVLKHELVFAHSTPLADAVERVTGRRPVLVAIGTANAAGALSQLRAP
jgi:hypothetical protein